MPTPTDKVRYDGFLAIDGGMNSGVATSLIPPNQLAFAINSTVRGGYPTYRSPFQEINLSFGGDTVLQAHFEGGAWQDASVYEADDGTGSLLAAIGGRLYRIPEPDALNNSVVQEVTISKATSTTAVFIAPAPGGLVTIDVVDSSQISVGFEILINGKNWVVTAVPSPTQITVQNVDAPAGPVAIGAIVQYFDLNPAARQTWMQQVEKWTIVNDGQSVPIIFDGASSRRSPQGGAKPGISAGTVMAYWLGRLWWANPDGLTFRAGDAVYSSSGTGAENKRDAVLYQTQNLFLNGGGNFTVPSNAGRIRAMRPVNVLDNSLGQGPLQVGTSQMIFGCTAPVDETQWANVKDPILGVSNINSGPVGHYSTVLVNGDMWYRSYKGFQSLVMARREFNSWGNVPQSQEMNRILELDNPNLLEFGSGVEFDNRQLQTAGPVTTDRGVYHQGLIAMDFDVISSLRDKKPPVYDGVWTGLRVLKIVKGQFGERPRCFVFSFTESGTIKLFEILPTVNTNFGDNGSTVPITWTAETGEMFRKWGIGPFLKSRLWDGELFIDELLGEANFQIFYKPDHAACWTPWTQFTVCANTCEQASSPYECLAGVNFKPQFRNQLGFGEPPPICNPNTGTAYREGYTFQLKIVVTGAARLKGVRLKAVPVDESEFPPVQCPADCSPTVFSNVIVCASCEDLDATALVNNGADLAMGAYIDGIRLCLPAGAFTSYESQEAVDEQAQSYIDSLFAANLAAGKLICQVIAWECGGTYNDVDGIPVEITPDCANSIGVMSGSGRTATDAPVPPASNNVCGATPVHFYQCSANVNGSIGPFPVDRLITISGTYHAQAGALFTLDCGTGVNSVGFQAELSGFSDTFAMTFNNDAGFDESGTWSVSGTLPAGISGTIALVTDILGLSDPGLDQPPVGNLSITSITIE